MVASHNNLPDLQQQKVKIRTLDHSCSITAGHSAMAASRNNPPDSMFQIRAIPISFTESLHDWGNNQQLAEIITSIDGGKHLQELKARVHNLTISSVHRRHLQDTTRTAILAVVIPLVILDLLPTTFVAA